MHGLALILETIGARFDALEFRLGPVRASRLLGHALRGCEPVEAVLRNWVDGVAMEHTRDPDTLAAVRILLALFLAEAARLGNKDYSALQRFRRKWLSRCILRLGVRRLSVDLVFLSNIDLQSP